MTSRNLHLKYCTFDLLFLQLLRNGGADLVDEMKFQVKNQFDSGPY